LPAEFVDEKADEIGRQVDRMTKRVERLLDISRLTGGPIESLSLERFDLAELIADRLSTLRQTDPELTVEAHVAPDEPESGIPGTWDRERMGQILDNLIQNARGDVDSDDGSATIVIQVEAKEQSNLGVPAVEMIVGDPDLRIDADSHPLELEDVVRQSRDEGIGWSCLGLWIVEQLVRVFGGELTVEEQPELGTCYRVTIPRDISTYVCEAAQ
jgi:two-component system sensor histidine kinase MtrB